MFAALFVVAVATLVPETAAPCGMQVTALFPTGR
jgi:hypothetical protein